MKFLHRNFPVSRVKYNGRFRRGIIFDDGEVYLYSDPKHMVSIKYKLINVLRETFLVNDDVCLIVLDHFLRTNE